MSFVNEAGLLVFSLLRIERQSANWTVFPLVVTQDADRVWRIGRM
jgi:hypothetical protein